MKSHFRQAYAYRLPEKAHPFDLFVWLTDDDRSWQRGYRDGRSGRFEFSPTFDSSGKHRERLHGIDVGSYRSGFYEGRDVWMRALGVDDD